MLKIETNTKAVERRIRTAARKKGFAQFLLDFEHGQWWLRKASGAAWSVVDAEGGGSIDGFDFEQVSEGIED